MRVPGLAAVCGIALAVAAAAGQGPPPPLETNEELRDQVRRTETAFAKTMADRDHAAFVRFLADDTIWLGGSVLRGKQQVADAWKRYYEGKQAPFSWEPERVEVDDAGTLGISVGPVRDPAGKRVGTYNSIWRRGPDGWKIIFDTGCPPCDPPPAPSPAASPAPN
jgi:ketosteroid isomerase-like protein